MMFYYIKLEYDQLTVIAFQSTDIEIAVQCAVCSVHIYLASLQHILQKKKSFNHNKCKVLGTLYNTHYLYCVTNILSNGLASTQLSSPDTTVYLTTPHTKLPFRNHPPGIPATPAPPLNQIQKNETRWRRGVWFCLVITLYSHQRF